MVRKIKKAKVTWVILRSAIGFEKRLKVSSEFMQPIFRFPVKKKLSVFESIEGNTVETVTKSLETVDFIYEGKQETDTATYLYYAERE